MYCKKCGAECEENARFCDNCGCPLTRQRQHPVIEPKSDKKKNNSLNRGDIFFQKGGEAQPREKKKEKQGLEIALIVLGILAIALIVSGVLFIRWYTSPEQQIIRALQNDDYEKAVQVYEANLYGTENAELAKALVERLDAIKNDFLNERETYEVTLQEIATLESMKMDEVNTYAEEVLEYVENLNASRAAYQSAEALYEKGDYIAAIEQYKQVIEDDPCYEEAKTRLNAAADAYREDMLGQAEELVNEGEYDKAINIIENALGNLKSDVRLTEQLAVYVSDMEEQLLASYLSAAQEYANTDDFQKAIEILAEGLEDFPENADMLNAQADYQERQKNQKIDEALEKAKSCADKGDYKSAMAALNPVMKTYADEERLTAAYEEYEQAYEEQQIMAVLAMAEQYVADENYKDALNTLSSGLSSHPASEELETAYDKYAQEYVVAVLTKAKEQVGDLDYSSALRTLQAGLNVLPDNEELQTAYDKYDAEKPVSLFSLDYFNATSDTSVVSNSDIKDNTGEPHAIAYRIYNSYNSSSNSGSVIYKINQKYTSLNGTYFLSFDNRTTKTIHYLKIYGDDDLLYSISITGGSVPVDFSVDITGVEYLKIQCTLSYSGLSTASQSYLTDTYLFK